MTYLLCLALITIYFNVSGDKGKQLNIKDQPDIDKEVEYIEQKKNNLRPKGSDYSHMRGQNQK